MAVLGQNLHISEQMLSASTALVREQQVPGPPSAMAI
jgi:hypothetical protein